MYQGEIVVKHYFKSEQFDNLYNYAGDDLGVIYNTQVSIFKVWIPQADEVEVALYREGNGGEAIKHLKMENCTQGIWQAKELGDLNGIYYTYLVKRNNEVFEVVDPYAKAAGVNGERGMVIDLKSTNPKGWDEQNIPTLEAPTDAVIYELHVRDLSMDPAGNMKAKGKYLAFTEEGTKTNDGKATGIDHIKELGITHVQLLPCYDYISIDESKLEENNFNWGYDPLNYNIPEGSYATDPFHGEVRIKEYKEAIMALHNKGLGVIMDVVYNHTAQSIDSKLNMLVPHYYHRVLEDGRFSNGSDCGNEIASERYMVRKMIVDSLIYWATEYKIDGFRFDLMGILDTETMNIIRDELVKINPQIILYGEGWTGGPCAIPEEERAMKKNAMQLNKVGVFNDDLRDAIKGSVFETEERGFVSGEVDTEESIKFGIVAATDYPGIDYEKVNYSDAPYAAEPGQCVNYVSVHDNLTLWDKIELSMPEADEKERIEIHKLCGAIILLSQGVPVLNAGSDFARTKYGEHNSYKSPDSINQLEWERKTTYYNIFEYFKGLITLRKSHPAFRMRTSDEIKERLSFLEMPASNMVGFKIVSTKGEDDWEEIVVIFNATTTMQNVKLDKENWLVVANNEKAGNEVLDEVVGNNVAVKAKSAIILIKKN